MFAMLDVEWIPRQSLFQRLLSWLRREEVFVWEEIPLGGGGLKKLTVFLEIDAEENRNEKRVAQALSFLRCNQMSGVVLPAHFSFARMLPLYHLVPAHPAGLYRRLAAKLAIQAADMLSLDASVGAVLMAKRVTPEVCAAAEALCGRVRQLVICVRGDAGDLSASLSRQFGVSVIVNPPAHYLWKSDLFLIFDPIDWIDVWTPKPKSALLFLYGACDGTLPHGPMIVNGASLSPPHRLVGDWPAGCDTEALLTALVASGALSVSEVGVRALLRDGVPAY